MPIELREENGVAWMKYQWIMWRPVSIFVSMPYSVQWLLPGSSGTGDKQGSSYADSTTGPQIIWISDI